jgi:hypothetical protein
LPQAIAGGMLLWALYPGNSSGYYTLLHWVCCGTLIYLVYKAVKLKRQIWIWILVITALVYNPIFRLHLGELWFTINLITAGIVVVSIFPLRNLLLKIGKTKERLMSKVNINTLTTITLGTLDHFTLLIDL